jgi:hypothetical protein
MTKWVNRNHHSLVVDVITDDAELRVAELKQRAVVYARGERIYVRSYGEFKAKFMPQETPKQT